MLSINLIAFVESVSNLLPLQNEYRIKNVKTDTSLFVIIFKSLIDQCICGRNDLLFCFDVFFYELLGMQLYL